MKFINTRDVQVGQRLRINLGYGSICEALVTQKGAIGDRKIPDIIMFTTDDGQVKYALGDVQLEVLDTTQ